MKAKDCLLHQYSDCLPWTSSIRTRFLMFIQSKRGQVKCVYPIIPAPVPMPGVDVHDMKGNAEGFYNL